MISRELYEELSRHQDALEDELETLSAASHAVASALRSERSAVLAEIATLRRRKRGGEGSQLEIDGMEVGERRRDPLVLEILRLTSPAGTPKNGKAKQIDLEKLVGTREECLARAEKRHHRGPGRPKKTKGKAAAEESESGGG